jgi:flagellar motor switch protein FliN/FliY
MFGFPIDISPPRSSVVKFGEGLNFPFDEINRPVVQISFNMHVEGLIDSEIMQVMPVDFAKDIVDRMMNPKPVEKPVIEPIPAAAPAPPSPDQQVGFAAPPPPPPPPGYDQPQHAPPGYQPQQYAPPPGYGYPPPGYPQYAPPPPHHPSVDVRPASFTAFSGDPGIVAGLGENMDLLLDVPLSVSVEIGKSKKYIKDILDFNNGTIVVLDKMAGELVDVVVNGKLIAKGEVVIIDDNYGCRITEIVSPSKRINL